MWFPFALISALISGGRRVYEKNLTNTFGNFAMGFIVQAFSLLPSFVLIFLLPGGTDIGSLPWRFWWPLLIIWFILYPIQTYFMYRAVREADISTVTPIMCLLPVFNVGTSFILLGEVPTLFGWVGIILIVFGTYFMLSHKKGNTNFSLPMLSKKWFWPFILLGLVQAISYTAMAYAFKYGPVSYVLAIRAGSYILAGLYGVIILKETFSVRKVIAFVCFLFGVIALAFA